MTKSKITCCAPKCNSGKSDLQDQVSWHKIPTDADRNTRWISSFPKLEWTYSASSRLCSKHFQPSDYKSESSDTNKDRKKKNNVITRKILKPDAVPSLWPNVSLESLKTPVTPRTTKLSSAAKRRTSEESLVHERDTIASIGELDDEKFILPPRCHRISEGNTRVINRTLIRILVQSGRAPFGAPQPMYV